jgi:hypothetical protein
MGGRNIYIVRSTEKLTQMSWPTNHSSGTLANRKHCETCIQAKLTQLVSRRPPREPATRPFQRISIDLIQLLEQGERCYNGDQHLFHMADQDSKWHEGSCMPDKTKETLTRAFKRLLAKIERQYNGKVIIIRLEIRRAPRDMQRSWNCSRAASNRSKEPRN